MHMTRRYGLVIKPFQVILYQPGCFAKMMAGDYMGIFFWFIAVFDKSNLAVSKARRPNINEITAHLSAGAIFPAKFIRNSSSGSMVGLMAADNAKL